MRLQALLASIMLDRAIVKGVLSVRQCPSVGHTHDTRLNGIKILDLE